MAIKNWYLDKRVFVPGKQNPYMNLANFEWFNDIVSQIIYGTTPGIPAGPLLFRNGITPTPTTANYIVEWGGLLTQDTVISGNSLFDVLFKDIPEITFLGDSTILSGSSELSLRTPSYLTRPVGSILQKIGVGGQTEYTPFELPLVDGALGEALITDGLGTLTWQSVAPTGADNGLTLVGTDVHLGGTLIKPTTILGAGFPLNIFNMSSFQWESVGIGLLEADDLLLRGNSSLSVQTPDVVGATATVGSILQLTVNTGKVEYTPYTLPLTAGALGEVATVDGSGNVVFSAPAVGGLTAADNGLNVVGSTVKLGGALLQNTFVSGATREMNFDTVKDFNVVATDSIQLQVTSDTTTDDRSRPLVAYKSGSDIGAINQEEIVTIQVFDWDEIITGTRYKMFPIPAHLINAMEWRDVTVSTFTTSVGTAGKGVEVRIETNTGVSGNNFNHTFGNNTYTPGTPVALTGYGGKIRVRAVATDDLTPGATDIEGLAVTLRFTSK